MKGNKQMKTIANITYPAFALFAFACLALSPQARAVCQQGCDVFFNNTFLGWDALVNNDDGSYNAAIGDGALENNTTGSGNTAIGSGALALNIDGGGNTATGTGALVNNTSGGSNTGIGDAALSHNFTGGGNTATPMTVLHLQNTG